MSGAMEQREMNGTFRRFKPYPEYKDSGVEWLGEIPAHWEVTRLKHLARIASGFAPPERYDRSTGEYPVYGSNGLIGYCDEYLVSQETLAVGRVGASGSVNVVPAQSWVSDNALLLQGLRPRARLPWLRYVLETMNLGTQAAKNAQPIITGTFLGNQALATPSEEEQRAIAAFLDRETGKIDALVAKKERLIELLQEKRTALITRAVTKGLDPNVPMKDSGVEWLGEIPAHWEVRRVKSITIEHKQGFYTEEAYVDEGVKLARITDINDRANVQFEKMPFVQISEKEERAFGLAEGDFLFARSGTIGRFGIIRQPERAVFASYLIRFKFGAVNPEFLRYAFDSKCFRESLISSLHGGANQNVHAENIKAQWIAVPPCGEQALIVAFLLEEAEGLDALIAKIFDGTERLKEFRTALISAAVTGKMDVREEAA